MRLFRKSYLAVDASSPRQLLSVMILNNHPQNLSPLADADYKPVY